MTPEQLLQHHDQALLWGQAPGVVGGPDTAAAYQQALAVRQLRQQRGEVPKGYKIGFTNRTLWQRYEVFGPMWGTVWDTGLGFAEPAASGAAEGRID
jgi:2-oxo-3-hexenedioate decarboxylase